MAGNFIRDSVIHPFAHQIFIEFLLGASYHPRHGGICLGSKGHSSYFLEVHQWNEVIASATNSEATFLSEYEKALLRTESGLEDQLTTYPPS